MSYCVNCGVELESGLKKCPLCQTTVYNPNVKTEEKSEQTPAFSENVYIPAGIKKRFIAYVVSMFLLIPNIVCSFANAIFYTNSFWSLYVNSTSTLVWIVFVFPFFTKKFRPYLMWAFDTLAVGFYVFFFFVMGYQSIDWFYDSALPIIISSSLMILIYMAWVRKNKRHWVLKAAHIVADIAVESIVVGFVLDIYRGFPRAFEIGMIIFVSCLFIIAFLIYCYLSKHVRNWLSKKFFV